LFNHSKVVIIPSNQQRYANDQRFTHRLNDGSGRVYATLGAGQPTDKCCSYGLIGSPLIGKPDRLTDLNLSANTSDQLLTLPAGKTEDEVIEELFKRDGTYDSYEADVDYALFPTSWADGYNSNSYALGLLLATGFKNLKVPPGTPGYNKPLDVSYFDPPRRGVVSVRECGLEGC
jgi:hypothetical protein